MHYEQKQIAVLGLGRSGEAAATLLKEENAMVTVIDNATEESLRHRCDRLRRLGIQVLTGPGAEKGSPVHLDRTIISPGIDPVTPLVQYFLKRRIEMIGELELAWELCHCPVVAITGTNGKTTTTELVERLLRNAGLRTIAGGNIGLPFSEAVRQSRELDYMTLEVSSFQLEQIRTFQPKVAVWLNFTADHLDRYASIDEYRAAKLRIFENQTADDFAVVNAADGLPPLRARTLTFSAGDHPADLTLRDSTILYHGEPIYEMSQGKLRGRHNAENLMATIGVGLALGLDAQQLNAALGDYQAPPHRCELIRTLDEVEYVNDSKATNLDALEKALQSEQRPVVLIAGGKDKGFGYESLRDLVKQRVKSAILIGEMRERIAADWHDTAPCQLAETMTEAVWAARRLAQPGDVVLMSPGTSSFDMFKSYADRGDQFRSVVEALS